MGLAAALYFFSRALIIKIKFFFSGSNNKEAANHESFVIYCEGSQYWNIFKPILDEFEKKNINVTYLTSAEKDHFFNESYQYIKGIYIGEGNKAFAHLNLLEADICLMTTPGLEVYQLKRSKGVSHYAHILHSPDDPTSYRLFGTDWFDSVLLTGEYQVAELRLLEAKRGTPKKELPVVGCTYLDVYNDKIKSIPAEENHIFTVLISPSWGEGTLLKAFGENLLDPLVKTSWRIIIRPHPQSKKQETEMLSRLETRYKDNKNIEWDNSLNELISLSHSDIMISDFSSIVLNYIFLFNKPVIYTTAHYNIKMYDDSDLDTPPWKFEALKTFGIELKEAELCNIEEIIKKASAIEELQAARKMAKETAWQYIGESAVRTVDFLVSTRERILKDA
nr:CDP-glycerol glycerophosphotransferase family protein [Leadbettera azotonutricia]